MQVYSIGKACKGSGFRLPEFIGLEKACKVLRLRAVQVCLGFAACRRCNDAPGCHASQLLAPQCKTGQVPVRYIQAALLLLIQFSQCACSSHTACLCKLQGGCWLSPRIGEESATMNEHKRMKVSFVGFFHVVNHWPKMEPGFWKRTSFVRS